MADDEGKIERTLDLIENYGGIDGSHHKQWILDQIVRILTGKHYETWLENYEDRDDDGNPQCEWDTGIAP